MNGARTEGAADGLREAVAQALRGPFEPRMDHSHQGADAAIAAVREWDAAHSAPQPVDCCEVCWHNAWEPTANGRRCLCCWQSAELEALTKAPQPVPVVATGAGADDALSPADIEILVGAMEWTRRLREELYPGLTDAVCARLRAVPAPGAPAAQATAPAGGVERLAGMTCNNCGGAMVRSLNSFHGTLCRGEDGNSPGCGMRHDWTRAEIEAMARVGVRT